MINLGVGNGGTHPTFTIFNYVFSPLVYEKLLLSSNYDYHD